MIGEVLVDVMFVISVSNGLVIVEVDVEFWLLIGGLKKVEVLWKKWC